MDGDGKKRAGDKSSTPVTVPGQPPLHSNQAELGGDWQPVGSRHTLDGRLKGRDLSQVSVTLPAQTGRPTSQAAYFLSNVERKASIAEYLKALCKKEGYGLVLFEVATLVGGEAHDLMSSEVQHDWIDRIERGDFEVQIHSPPCVSWSRPIWANNSRPQQCRDRQHPWGLPGQKPAQQRRAEKGNIFVWFTIRDLTASQEARTRGCRVASLLKHPEDLWMTHRGETASIWQ